MPVVPYVRKEDSRGQGFSPARPREVPAADEPWLLMAAAQMDAQGRLVEAESEVPRSMSWVGSIEPRAMDNIRDNRDVKLDKDSGQTLISPRDTVYPTNRNR